MSKAMGEPEVRRRYRVWAVLLTIAALCIHLYVWKRLSPTGADGRRDYGAIRLADEGNYYVHCADRVADEGLGYLTTEDSLRSPPLPWLWLLLLGRSIILARLANVVAIIAASWLIASIVRDRWGDTFALISFALCALGYQVVQFSATVLSEPPAYVFVCVALWAVHRADWHNRSRYVILAGVATALAACARPSLQLWPIAIAGVFILVWLQRRLHRKTPPVAPGWTLGRVLLLLAVHCALMAPWIVKNVICFGVPKVANGFGAVFYLGSEFRTDGDEPVFSGMDWPNHTVQGPGGHMSLDGERRLVEAAKANIRKRPVAWLQLAIRKVGRTLIGGPQWHFFPGATFRDKRRLDGGVEASVVFFWWSVLGAIVTVCGIGGLVMRSREGGGVFLVGIALALYMTALHAATYALPRFAMPMWPVFVLGSVALLARRPGKPALVALTLCWTSIVAYLLLAFAWRPVYEVSPDRSSFFAMTAERTLDPADASGMTIELDNRRPAFNTCIFVTSRIEPVDGKRTVGAALELREAGATAGFESSSAIGFAMRADGRPHTYMLSVGLNRTWRERNWGAIRLRIDGVKADQVDALRLQIGH
ncbi:MAG: glycosyltransferase family 39 protein [Phycisphaerales bacterium]|nr:glycosyltransferase family 39 protein [Phycisphaerales bacterium]